ncbi:ParA family protein [Tunturiibacter gelidoferens]|jgi:chromosome partitioning protein|uniref:Chromosome partitioning protein n=1 Tax=Tunturiibacter lichenicola TaxID=2051959 RepID=A0A7Y9NRB7_9BACT|nr:ParA family protein [Edaphobacter lichenicola]NYF54099.1 chromosome partitioning protein [Edaphobacter lichenicola]
MATVICVATQKGGTGKSSTAINVACALEVAGYRVIVVDTDPQATFSLWHRKRKKLGLNGFKVLQIPKGLLDEEIQALREDEKLDIILVDCPGNIEDITSTAVKLSDAVLSPLRPSSMDMTHSADTARFIKEMRNSYPDIRFILFLNAAMPRWNISRDIGPATREMLKNLPKTTVLEAKIPLAVAIAEFFGTGQSIFEYAPKSAAATAYKRLTKEVIQCLQN